jgi:DtxR family transcriptional regulator, manganese transport regulator
LEGPTKSAEDYLACIWELLEQKGYARIADVARHRSVAEASASTMIKRLATQGYLNRENYRGFTLTDTGRTIAIEVHSRRKILTRFLRSLGLPQNVITHDVDGPWNIASAERPWND